jgi:hypothetical protein
MAETFAGFPSGGIAFLARLAADITKPYFETNRDACLGSIGFGYRAALSAWAAAPGRRPIVAVTGDLLHLARLLKDADGIPHGNQRSEWDAGCRFDFENPDYCKRHPTVGQPVTDGPRFRAL